MVEKSPRLTKKTIIVLELIAQAGEAGITGYDLMKTAGIWSGTAYPLLKRIQGAGWITSKWEDNAIADASGRPRRKYYKITMTGQAQLREALAPKSNGHKPLNDVAGVTNS